MTPEQFAESLKKSCGENLVSVVLYGSAAAGDHIPGKSSYNTMLVLKDCGLGALKAVNTASKEWLKKDNPAPLLFTKDQLLSSGDTFPIELADMKDFNRTLYGEDLLPEITITPADLRLAVEREFKGKLLLLRRSYLLSGGDKKILAALMADSISEILVLCRAALRLHTASVPRAKLDCVTELRKHAEFDAAVFAEVHALRASGGKGAGDNEALFERYLKAAGQLSAAVDAWTKGK